ncbi:MAG: tRNA uridine(34) 5-carboxymethylaminomethyl modification radical SAM/GNAT enzyme Elp3 [Candidatus Anstonellaceae archaeon]
MASEKKTASSAYAAAAVQVKLGRIPKFSPKLHKQSRQELSLRAKAAKEAAKLLLADSSASLERIKNSLSEKHGITYLKNSEILAFIPSSPRTAALRQSLLKSPTRTLSGVSPVAIMPPPAYCGGKCTYCPKGENAPQSYTGYEPTTMRAIQNHYSARLQVLARLRQYEQQGHTADKCHLIIMGGTFLYIDEKPRHAFMKEAFDTLNGKKSANMASAINENEFAPYRAIGVTYETRPDYGYEYHADEMLLLGGTQVELGVQSLSDRVYSLVRRGHKVADVIRSTSILKNSGFKMTYHMMPGLFSTPKQDVSYFKRLFTGDSFQPDMLKIYPALVIQGTVLYRQWKRGEFEPYDTEKAAEVLADATRHIPSYVRIPRIQRDIPSPLISAGVKNSNLRQIVEAKLAEKGEKCRCIRCREIGSAIRKKSEIGKLKLALQRIDYSASGGKEIFLSYEDSEKDLLAAFLRLRIPNESHRKEIDANAPLPSTYAYQSAPAEKRNEKFAYRKQSRDKPNVLASIVRELHVYGQEAAIGEYNPLKLQHTGLGRKLLAEAERITKQEFGLEKVAVISGPGARGYYRKFGYELDGAYMCKGV